MSSVSTRIVRNPDVQNGSPCIEGTRWPTQTVLGFDCELAAIANAYPHLRLAQIRAAIRYEQSWPRRMHRQTWRLRFWLAAKLLGTDVDMLREASR